MPLLSHRAQQLNPTMITMSQSQFEFNPFNIDDDKDQGILPSSRNKAAPMASLLSQSTSTDSYTSGTSKTTNTASKRAAATQQQPLESVKEEGTLKLPPRLNVRLMLHEEVSSTAVANPGGHGGSFSQFSIEGVVRVSCNTSIILTWICIIL